MKNLIKRRLLDPEAAQNADVEEEMKEKLFHVALDDNEQSILIHCLNDERNILMQEGHTTDALDELIVKVGTAKQKNYKVVERSRSSDAR